MTTDQALTLLAVIFLLACGLIVYALLKESPTEGRTLPPDEPPGRRKP